MNLFETWPDSAGMDLAVENIVWLKFNSQSCCAMCLKDFKLSHISSWNQAKETTK